LGFIDSFLFKKRGISDNLLHIFFGTLRGLPELILKNLTTGIFCSLENLTLKKLDKKITCKSGKI
jgi:hypothetical protein